MRRILFSDNLEVGFKPALYMKNTMKYALQRMEKQRSDIFELPISRTKQSLVFGPPFHENSVVLTEISGLNALETEHNREFDGPKRFLGQSLGCDIGFRGWQDKIGEPIHGQEILPSETKDLNWKPP